MNIGDKVKLSNTKESGIITALLPGGQVEVELDGWNSKQVFSKNELRLFENLVENKSIEPQKLSNTFEKGIFLAYIPQKLPTGESLELYIINNTDWDLPFAISLNKTRTNHGLMAGFLKARNYQKHTERLLVANFDDWKTMNVQAIFYQENSFESKENLSFQKKFQANTFFQNKKTAPFLEKEGYVFRIDEPEIFINADELQEKLMEPKLSFKSVGSLQKPETEFDLHIENLTKNHRQLGNAEIFAMQIDAFEKHLDKAIATGLHDVIYIHGAGDWKLKKAIHEILEFHPHVSTFGNANEQKYGGGATYVNIK